MLYPTYTEEPTQDGEREVSLRRTGDVQVVMALYHVPAGSHPDFAPVDVLTEVLGNSPGGRLYKALVETKKASEEQAFNIQLKEPSFVIGSATMQKDQSLADAKAILIRTMEAAGKTPPSAEEVERAKASLLKETDLLLNNSAEVGLALTEWAAAGDWRLLFVHRDRIKKVTPADVQRVAAAYLKPDNRTVGTVLSNGQARPRRDSESDRRRHRRDDEGLQGERDARGRGGVRPVAGEHRRAHGALVAAERHEARAPAEDDPRQQRSVPA